MGLAMLFRWMFCVVALASAVTACGSGDRDLVVDQIIDNNGNGEYGIVLMRPCLESVVDDFPGADFRLIVASIKGQEDVSIESLSPEGQAHLAQTQLACIDLDAYRERLIGEAIERNPGIDPDCLRSQYRVAGTFEDMGVAIDPATRFCGGAAHGD